MKTREYTHISNYLKYMPSQKWKARSPQVDFSKGEGLL